MNKVFFGALALVLALIGWFLIVYGVRKTSQYEELGLSVLGIGLISCALFYATQHLNAVCSVVIAILAFAVVIRFYKIDRK